MAERPAGRRLPPWVGAASLGVVLVVALIIGTTGGPTHPSLAQRASALESQIKCPSCEDLSVAQSTASSALTVRQEITTLMAAGQSDQQIENLLVARYGPTILLRPPTHGLTLVVWVLPAVLGAGALVALGVLFYRRSTDLSALRQAQS